MLKFKALLSHQTILIVLFLALCLMRQIPLVAQELTTSQLPIVNTDDVRLFEDISYCNAGFGTQGFQFRFDNKEVHSNEIGNIYSPSFDLGSTPFLSLGCRFQKLSFEYFFIDDSVKFDKSINVRNVEYNTLEFQISAISVGYGFTLMDHRLHLETGVGYLLIQYEPGTDNSASGEVLSDSSPFAQLNLKLYFSSYFFLNWVNIKSLSNESVVSYSNRLGLNFLVRL